MHNTSRNCTRCQLPLTDAASQEAGIGPICRNLDNAVLARLIPSDIEAARAALAQVDLSSADPAALATLLNVEEALMADDAHTRQDWRLEVKRIEWALSFSGNNHLRANLTKVVGALGYTGLAALWDGDAATGKTTISFIQGQLVLQGPRNKGANKAIKAIKGCRLNKPNTLTPKFSWSVPAAQAEAFRTVVVSHWLNHAGLDEALAAAAEYVKANPEAVAPAVASKAAPKKASCSIETVGVILKVRMDYDKEKTPAYVNELKNALVWTDRRWNGVEKCWEIAAVHEAKVKALLTKHFGPEALHA